MSEDEPYKGAQTPTTEAPTHKSRKNTRRWCKGKAGREHRTDIRMRPSTYGYVCRVWGLRSGDWFCWHEIYCTVCGKVLRRRLPKEECPTWTSHQS